MQESRIELTSREMPRQWYNLLADLNGSFAPHLNPMTQQPVKMEDMLPIFPQALIEQEMSTQSMIDIPDEVLEIYQLSRPTPLIRARRLEKILDTPARIYYKYEGVNPGGSHKTNTSLAQAYYNKKAGIKKLVTETGAGQWGSALSFACHHFGLECQVFMVKVSYTQKPYRRTFMELFGAKVIASPSEVTQAGRDFLKKDPHSPGSLGVAISEAVEMAVQRDDTNYSLGSVLNHVMLHQTIIGEEAKLQMEKAGVYPDIIIGCAGGGSNFAGISFPFVKEKISGQQKNLRIIAVEPSACPTLCKGKFAYDFGDEAGFTPLLKMYTLGHNFVPAGIHAGGLRYHGMSPLVSHLYHHHLIEAENFDQVEVFEAARTFAQTEGIVPAPESAHAIRSAINHALACKASGQAQTILFNLSGHGFLDLGSYDAFIQQKLHNFTLTTHQIEENLKSLPVID